jgi:hypothetical protein
VVAAVCCTAILLAVRGVSGAMVYDLDSLVYQSRIVVGAELLDSASFVDKQTNISATRVRVLKVYKGQERLDSALAVEGLEVYFNQELTDIRQMGNTLQRGNQVVLFLRAGNTPSAANRMEGRPVQTWYVVNSGVRLVRKEGVWAVASHTPTSNPRKPLIDDSYFISNKLFPVVDFATFEKDLNASTVMEKKVRALADSKEAPDVKAAKIRDEIVNRPQLNGYDDNRYDYISDVLIEMWGSVATPQQIDELSAQRKGIQASRLGTLFIRVGRQYALQRIADPSQPMAQRVQWARDIGPMISSYFADLRARASNRTTPGSDTRQDFLTNVAMLAIANMDNPLGPTLLGGFRELGESYVQRNVPDPLRADIASAAEILESARAGVTGDSLTKLDNVVSILRQYK